MAIKGRDYTERRTLPFIKGLAWTCPWFNVANAAYQAMEGVRVLERVRKFDPGRGSQECGQAAALRTLGADRLMVEPVYNSSAPNSAYAADGSVAYSV